jgi:predicted nucleic acid-binding protein
MMSDITTGSNPEAFVLDAWALIAYLLGQPEGEMMRTYLGRAARQQIKLHVSVINLGEAFYMTWRKRSREIAEEAVQSVLFNLPVTYEAVDAPRALRAAEIKGQYSTAKSALSFADAFAIALAEELACPVLTGDPEFRNVEELIQIVWLRSPDRT